ncbi:2-amino-4-hydroxy-6-hydroxymethyldihydropteridine diphosphokinase [Zoogloea sp.]|uniref:2-amino-4-hydroxy-6- hydroxymethyldihydropteridine diphosphokinase n=1 Tax=Zoogloea sp. TaxID=49181 RepID=UPI0026222F2B|nr:2-amino-4-hydroxy-6-hydroxymethyldihydropteridine diphosphokinase [uncultured Zoogloea sp.]
MNTVRAYVALGANIGAPVQHLRAAVVDLAALPGTRVVARSSLYRSAPVGLVDQPDFINAVVAIDTRLEALPLLHALLAIEARHGRVRSVPNAPRTLDLDLLMHGDAIMDSAELTLPHPRMHERAFVLLPLLEIAPEVLLPGLGAARSFLPAVTGQAIERSEPM